MTAKKPDRKPVVKPADHGKPVPGQLVVPQHGNGLIRRGSLPGTNKGGSGPVPSVLRDRLRGSAADRIQVLEEIADGKVTLTLATKCGKCGYQPDKTVELKDLLPTPGDRRSAVDTLLKYGLGEKAEGAFTPQQAISFAKVYEGWLYANLAKELADRAVSEIQTTLKAEGL